jgi:phosphate:Na+ symporter
MTFWQPLAGLALFLFAMREIEAALEQLSGRSFRQFVRNHTDNPIQGVLSGTFVTAALQSSSLVGLMMLGLVGAGVIQMRNALSVIFGANLGTTATGWIVATIGFKLDLDAAALPLIGVCGLVYVLSERGKWHESARFGLSIGLLLMGLELIKDAVQGIENVVDVQRLAEFGTLEFVAFGLAFSAILQSSSATLAVTLSALYAGVIDLPAGAAVTIGANIGTTSTMLIGAFKGSASKKRVAAGHVAFNLITGLLALVLLSPMLGLIALVGVADPMYALVTFHSLFNLLGLVLFLPFIRQLASFLEHRFKDTDQAVNRHLTAVAETLPETAVEAVELETAHLLQRVIRQNLLVFDPPIRIAKGRIPVGSIDMDYDDRPGYRNFATEYQMTKRLEGEILAFTVVTQSAELEAAQSSRIDRCQRAVREAVHSAKSLKDIHSDLQSFDGSTNPALVAYGQRVRDVITGFNLALFSIRAEDSDELLLEDFIKLEQQVHRDHDEIHRTIYADIRRNRLDEGDISSLLNVNRELFASCRALIMALAVYALSPEQTATLEELPASVL